MRSRWVILTENFQKLCDEDEQLMYEEIFEKKNHKQQRARQDEEIKEVIEAMQRELVNIISLKCQKGELHE